MAHVAKAKLGTISVWLTGVALFGVIASAMWLALLEPQE